MTGVYIYLVKSVLRISESSVGRGGASLSRVSGLSV